MDGEIINLKKENVVKKKRSKYGFERLNKVGNALRFVGKNQNQVLAAAMTLVAHHNKIDGSMKGWRFDCFETSESTKENPITIIKRTA